MKKIFTIIALFVMSSTIAQNYDFITSGGISDASKISQEYIRPLEKGMAYAGSSGIINFTKSKKKISFTVGVNVGMAYTSMKDRTYDLKALDLEEFEATNPNYTVAQTISGSMENIDIQTKTKYQVPSLTPPFYKEEPVLKFNSPRGTNIPLTPYPIFTVGVYGYGTHVNFRYLPNFAPDDKANVVFYGFSIQHNIDEFIPILQEWPVHFALASGFQNTSIEFYLDIQPDKTKAGVSIGPENGPYDNQKAEIIVNSIPIQFVAYRSFGVLTVFGGLGYNIVNSTFAMRGNYPIYVTDPVDIFKISVKDIKDPFENHNDYSSIRFDAGMNIQVGFMKLMLSYSNSQYQVFQMGLGVRI